MKKCIIFVVICFLTNFPSFGDDNDLEELGFLLFQPNSTDQFVDAEQANLYLDNIANSILENNFTFVQIYVYGYAAVAQNDVDPLQLSQGRARFVIQKLEARGVSPALFSDPIAFGSVNLWGDNSDENNRQQNRRARILIGTDISVSITEEMPVLVQSDSGINMAETVIQDPKSIRSQIKFPWRVILLGSRLSPPMI